LNSFAGFGLGARLKPPKSAYWALKRRITRSSARGAGGLVKLFRLTTASLHLKFDAIDVDLNVEQPLDYAAPRFSVLPGTTTRDGACSQTGLSLA
jgi:hypothetical protein